MPGLFISYARADDEAFAARLQRDLVGLGFTVWWDRAAMESRGLTFQQEIRDAIAAADRLVLVIGPEAAKSDYVGTEWRFALQVCKVVVPVLRIGAPSLVPSELATKQDFRLIPEELRNFHCPDFRETNNRPYEESLAELVRILRTAPARLATLHGVESLPPHYIARATELQRLRNMVLPDVEKNGVVGRGGRVSALYGMAGSGKSALAAALARECTVQRSFADGIVWLRLGRSPELVQCMADVGDAFKDEPDRYRGLNAAKARLSALLERRNCLLILDDVWDVHHAEPFVNALGTDTRSRLLLTTRDRAVPTAFGAHELHVDMLDEGDSLKLLAGWSGEDVNRLPTEAAEIASECGYLPLALAIAGAMTRGRSQRWRNVLHKLRVADLERLGRDFPNYPHPNLLRAIDVGVDALPDDARSRYVHLAVYPEGVAVPEAALAVFWEIDEIETQDLVDLLIDRSLARSHDRGGLTLHDLQHDYVLKKAGDVRLLHERLVNAYQNLRKDGWHSIPDDGYFFDHLSYHLAEAGQSEELYTLIDKSWMDAQHQRTRSHRAFSADLERAIVAAKDDEKALATEIAAGLVYATLAAISSAVPPAVLAVFVHAGRVEEAIDHVSLIPDAMKRVKGYEAVAKALLDHGNRDKARQVLLQALTTAWLVEASSNDTNPWQRVANGLLALGSGSLGTGKVRHISAEAIEMAKATAIGSIAPMLISVGEVAAVLSAIESLRSDVARNHVRRVVVLPLLEAGEIKRAHGLADAIDDPKEHSDLLAQVAIAYVRAGDNSTAAEMAAKIGGSTLAAVVRPLADEGHFDQAIELLKRCDPGPADAARLILAEAVARSGDSTAALDIAKANAAAIQAVLRIAAVILADSDDLAAAWKVIEMLPDPERQIVMAHETAELLLESGKPDRAAAFAESIVVRARAIGSAGPSALSLAAEVLRKAGRHERALELGRQALSEVAGDEDPRILDSMRAEIGESLVEMGDYAAALQIAKDIGTEVSQAVVWLAASQAMSNTGLAEQALEVARKIPHQRARLAGVRQAANAFIKSGHVQRAAAIACEAFLEAAGIEDTAECAESLADFAVVIKETGISDGIEQIYEEWVAAGENAVAAAVAGHTLAELTGNLEKVLAALENAPGRDFELKVLSVIVSVSENVHAYGSSITEYALRRSTDVGAMDARLCAFVSMATCLRETTYAPEAFRLAAWASNQKGWKIADSPMFSVALNDVCQLFALAGNIGPAIEFSSALEPSKRAWTFCTMLTSGAKPEDLQAAIDGLEDPTACALVLSACADAWARSGAFAEANEAANRAWSAALSVKSQGGLLDVAGLERVPSQQDLDELITLLNGVVEEMKHKPESTGADSSSPFGGPEGSKPGQTGEKDDFVPETAKEQVGSSVDVERVAKANEAEMLALGWAAKALAAVGAKEAVREIAQNLMERTTHTSEFLVAGMSFASAAYALNKVGFPEDAAVIAHMALRAIGSRGVDSIACQVLGGAAADLLAVLGATDRSDLLCLIEQIGPSTDRAPTLCTIGCALAGVGDHSAARQMLDLAMEAADQITVPEKRASALADVAAGYTLLKEQPVALATLRRAFDAARRDSRRSMLSVIAKGAPTIRAQDDGQTLAQVVERVQQVEGWWTSTKVERGMGCP